MEIFSYLYGGKTLRLRMSFVFTNCRHSVRIVQCRLDGFHPVCGQGSSIPTSPSYMQPSQRVSLFAPVGIKVYHLNSFHSILIRWT